MHLPVIHPPAMPTPAAVALDTVLFDNAPGGIPIKPVPISFTAGDPLGGSTGWSSIEDAIAAASRLTSGPQGSAAIVRDGTRFVARAVLERGRPRELTTAVSNFGGRPWVHPDVVAFVDGAWVERIR